MQTKAFIIFLSLSLLFFYTELFAQSPYKITFLKDGTIIGCGTITSITSLIISNSVEPLTVNDINSLSRENVNVLDRSATYKYSKTLSNVSDGLLIMLLSTPALFVLDSKIRNDWFTIGLMYSETIMLSDSFRRYAKGYVQRIRPLVYNPDAPIYVKTESDSRKSFFSGHTTFGFASAVFLSKVYSDYKPRSKYRKFVWAGSLACATTVGILRYESGKHFPTDILTGALVGSITGYTIPYIHKVKDNN